MDAFLRLDSLSLRKKSLMAVAKNLKVIICVDSAIRNVDGNVDQGTHEGGRSRCKRLEWSSKALITT